MKGPRTRELRAYLLDLVREERMLEGLYSLSHTPEQIAQARADWKRSYRSIREMLAIHDSLPDRDIAKPERHRNHGMSCFVQS